MKISDLTAGAIALGLAVSSSAAFAQSWPERPIKMLIGFAAGSSADVSARIAAEGMARSLGQPVVIEVRAGASSNIAADSVAKADPDGYTILFSSIANVINKAVSLPGAVDIVKDLKPVAMICEVPNLLVVNPDVKATSVAELIALAKAEPGKLNYGSSGLGSTPHLSAELFANMAGVKLVHVPYKGTAQAAQDLVGGTLHVMFAPSSTVLGLIESKKLRALAWTTAKRVAVLPDVPTAGEAGLPGFETAIWFGIHGPAKLPEAITEKIAGAAAAAISGEGAGKAFRTQGIETLKGGPADYGRFVEKELKKWTDVVAKAGIKS